MLAKFCKSAQDEQTIAETIVLASHIKCFMLESLVDSVKE